MAKKISDYVPVLNAEGMDYLLGANASGLSAQVGTVTLTGNAQTITLANEMANDTYAVLLTNESDGARIPACYKSTTEFSLNNAGDPNDILSYVVIGRLLNQKA